MIRGMNFGFYAPCGVLGSAWAREQADAMANLGINWVVLCPTVTADSIQSTVQFRDFAASPRDDEVINIIRYLRDRKINVMLRPMLEAQDGLDRNSVWFPYDSERMPGKCSTKRADWFRSFRQRAVFYATIAQETGCEAYGLESELDRLTDEVGHWKDVIAGVRAVYAGHVTCNHWYSFGDWRTYLRNPDHWWHQLDSLSCSYYAKAADRPGCGATEMADTLRTGRLDPHGALEYWREVAQLFGKPLFFGETGCPAAAGGAMRPWNWKVADCAYDPQEQVNFFNALLQVFGEEPWWRGLCWWKWDEHNRRPELANDPAGDKGFTVAGKPVSQCFSTWAAQQRSSTVLKIK